MAQRYKVVLLGASHTGKTSIIHRYTSGEFVQNTVASTQAAFFQKKLKIDTTEMWLDIWDTAGQERFHALTPMFYRDAQGAFVVFDLTDKNSFDKAKQWVAELHQSRGDQCKLMLLGNKSDLASIRAVDQNAINEYVQSQHFQYFECSAKSGQNIEKAFTQLAKLLEESSPGGGSSLSNGRKRTSVRLDKAPPPENDSCC